MSEYTLQADVRDDRGKEKAKKLRQNGQFPAIVYGAEADPVSLTLAIRETELVLQRTHGEKVLVDLHYGEKSDKVFVRNVQRDPLSNKLLHVDFFRVDLNKEINTSVPVLPVGEAVGLRMGGLLETLSRQIDIRCLPTKVPPHIEVNVSALEVGQAIHVSDLPKIDGVVYTGAPETVVFLVAGKQKEEGTASSAAAEGAAAPAAGA